MITGQEETLKNQLVASIVSSIAAETGYSITDTTAITGIAKGIADALIPFIVANAEVIINGGSGTIS